MYCVLSTGILYSWQVAHLPHQVLAPLAAQKQLTPANNVSKSSQKFISLHELKFEPLREKIVGKLDFSRKIPDDFTQKAMQ